MWSEVKLPSGLGGNVNIRIKANAALTILTLGLFMLPAHSQAHFPGLYGKEFIRSEPAQQDERPPSPPIPATPMDDADADSYKQQLEEQELMGGPYAEALAEPLSSLGRYYRDRGKYREALDLYERAVHIVRVNDGLYSERQIPLVRDLLELYRSVGDLETLDDRYDYFFRLYGSGQPPYTAVRRQASLEYLRWLREAYSSGLDGGNNRRLVEMYKLTERILKSVAQIPDVDQAFHRELVLSQMRNLYLLLGSNNFQDESFGGGSTGRVHASHDSSSSIVQQRMWFLQRTGVAIGRKLLQDLMTQSPQLDPIERAGLHLELGDWYQWNEILRSAGEEYAKVEQILQQAGELDLLDQWLGAPVELPDNNAFGQSNQLTSDAKPVVATFHYDISAKGYLSNIEVDTQDPDEASVGLRIKRMLKGTHFRPRFVSGQAEPMENLTRQYQLVN